MSANIATAIGWALIASASVSVCAAEATVRVDGAWARRAPMLDGSGNGAVYATLVNAGASGDALIAAASDVAGVVEIHESYPESGMMKMRQVPRIAVGPGERVELKPGGYHVMLLNLKRDLRAGDAMALTLVFEKAGKIAVTAEIR